MRTVGSVAQKLTDQQLGTVVDTLSKMRDDLHVTIGDALRAMWHEEDMRKMTTMAKGNDHDG